MKIPIYVSIAASGLCIILASALFDQIEVQRQEREFLEQELREVTNRLFEFRNGSSPDRASQEIVTDLLILSQTDDDAKRIVSKYKLKEEGRPPSPAQNPQSPPRI